MKALDNSIVLFVSRDEALILVAAPVIPPQTKPGVSPWGHQAHDAV